MTFSKLKSLKLELEFVMLSRLFFFMNYDFCYADYAITCDLRSTVRNYTIAYYKKPCLRFKDADALLTS